ncbi:MAG: hypothetical protein C0615_05360 [Desulfuromonas sp.]|mgnify:CR=1 FL=1|nr:MAG: hypothetical protein C0615_05360 [Desulfuromonas sp.]
MKRILIGLIGVLLLAGCGTFNEAYMLDQEFGQATRAAFDSQIAYPDYRYADTNPEGMEGINAEGVMDQYNKSYAEPPSDEVGVFEFGVTGDE